jgi:hypothetical protein
MIYISKVISLNPRQFLKTKTKLLYSLKKPLYGKNKKEPFELAAILGKNIFCLAPINTAFDSSRSGRTAANCSF